ncbi:MAG TPA: hypothetical protein VL147_01575, partial [Devosia sp.]|nr:hypothetical protein [Devosia sp.]
MLVAYQKAHAEFHAAHDSLTDCHRAMARASGELKRNQAIIDKLRAIVDAGPNAPMPEEREVDAPLMTDAEFLHQKELDPDAVNVGKSKVLFSMDEYIGGFSRFTAREP